MKFGQQFEFHKIPEWYQEYFDYNTLLNMLKASKLSIACNLFHLINRTQGTKVGRLVLLDLHSEAYQTSFIDGRPSSQAKRDFWRSGRVHGEKAGAD